MGLAKTCRRPRSRVQPRAEAAHRLRRCSQSLALWGLVCHVAEADWCAQFSHCEAPLQTTPRGLPTAQSVGRGQSRLPCARPSLVDKRLCMLPRPPVNPLLGEPVAPLTDAGTEVWDGGVLARAFGFRLPSRRPSL